MWKRHSRSCHRTQRKKTKNVNGEGDDRSRRPKKRRLLRINTVFLWKKSKRVDQKPSSNQSIKQTLKKSSEAERFCQI